MTTRFTVKWLIVRPNVLACHLEGRTKFVVKMISGQIVDQFCGNKLYLLSIQDLRCLRPMRNCDERGQLTDNQSVWRGAT